MNCTHELLQHVDVSQFTVYMTRDVRLDVKLNTPRLFSGDNLAFDTMPSQCFDSDRCTSFSHTSLFPNVKTNESPDQSRRSCPTRNTSGHLFHSLNNDILRTTDAVIGQKRALVKILGDSSSFDLHVETCCIWKRVAPWRRQVCSCFPT